MNKILQTFASNIELRHDKSPNTGCNSNLKERNPALLLKIKSISIIWKLHFYFSKMFSSVNGF